jgi:hypothetical protein
MSKAIDMDIEICGREDCDALRATFDAMEYNERTATGHPVKEILTHKVNEGLAQLQADSEVRRHKEETLRAHGSLW